MQKRKGFTMVELLVVVGIIGLLAFFLVPMLVSAKDRGKEAAVKGVMHSVHLALEAYDMENSVYPQEKSIALESLCNNYLLSGGYLSSIPQNPFTGKAYKDSDTAGKIIYAYSESTAKYTLSGYNRFGTKKILELTNM